MCAYRPGRCAASKVIFEGIQEETNNDPDPFGAR